MKGISYIVDTKGRRKSVIIDLKLIQANRSKVEFLLHGIIAKNRQKESKIQLSSAVRKLKKAGKLN
jgi:hypothetical protein